MGYSVSSAVEGTGFIVTDGELWVHQDPTSGDVSVFFRQPLTLVDNTYGANSTGWLFDVAYEMIVSGDLFAANGFGKVSIPVAHDSPNKTAKNKVFPKLEGEIPEPASMLIVTAGVGLFVARRRCRTHA